MSQEREMLEMAARAAGIVSLRWGIDKPERQINGEGQFIGATWNPLTDDGDAFRLAVYLSMFTEFDFKQLQSCRSSDEDPYSATRLAITRAAASIGEKMRDEAMGEEL